MLRLLRVLWVTLAETIVARARRGRLLPSWTFRFEWVVRFLCRDAIEIMAWPPARLRADLDARRYPSSAAAKIRPTASTVGGVPVFTFTPPDARGGLVVYFHGGSYAFGSAGTTHAELIASLALATGSEIVAPEYRLAPEHPYPAALEDALAVCSALEAQRPRERIVLAGDSAGANLALSLALRLRDAGRRQPEALLLVSPWLDLTASRPSCRDNERFDYGRTGFLLAQARDFAGGLPLDDPRVSPLGAELSGLAPLLVVVGGAERLHDEGVELVALARRAGVAAELYVAAELPHVPPLFAAFHPEGARALARSAQYVRQKLE